MSLEGLFVGIVTRDCRFQILPLKLPRYSYQCQITKVIFCYIRIWGSSCTIFMCLLSVCLSVCVTPSVLMKMCRLKVHWAVTLLYHCSSEIFSKKKKVLCYVRKQIPCQTFYTVLNNMPLHDDCRFHVVTGKLDY